MDSNFKYLFAEKVGRELCVKYNEDWEMSCYEYLSDKGYSLRPASEQHWNRQINEVGKLVVCYLLDDDLHIFDVGDF